MISRFNGVFILLKHGYDLIVISGYFFYIKEYIDEFDESLLLIIIFNKINEFEEFFKLIDFKGCEIDLI
jgi:hypothetical protein